MPLETLNCGRCGAPLRVPESAQFVTCNHCRSSLAIRRMDSVTLTERVSAAEGKLEQVEAELAELVYRNRVSEEHRRWERERARLIGKDQNGNEITPSMSDGWLAFVFALVMSGLLASWGFGLMALVPAAVGTMILMMTGRAVAEYQRADRRHRARLHEITRGPTDAPSPSQLLRELERAPTPEEYLQSLSAEEIST